MAETVSAQFRFLSAGGPEAGVYLDAADGEAGMDHEEPISCPPSV